MRVQEIIHDMHFYVDNNIHNVHNDNITKAQNGDKTKRGTVCQKIKL